MSTFRTIDSHWQDGYYATLPNLKKNTSVKHVLPHIIRRGVALKEELSICHLTNMYSSFCNYTADHG